MSSNYLSTFKEQRLLLFVTRATLDFRQHFQQLPTLNFTFQSLLKEIERKKQQFSFSAKFPMKPPPYLGIPSIV